MRGVAQVGSDWQSESLTIANHGATHDKPCVDDKSDKSQHLVCLGTLFRHVLGP